MKAHINVDKDNGPLHSAETSATNFHDLNPAAELQHGEEMVVYADADYQRIEKREKMHGKAIDPSVAMQPGKRYAFAETPEGRPDDRIETAKAHIRDKSEDPFRGMTKQFGFQKT